MNLLKSTVFQFSLFVLAVMALVISFVPNSGITWLLWVDTANTFLITYAGKEGFRYGSIAYEGANKNE